MINCTFIIVCYNDNSNLRISLEKMSKFLSDEIKLLVIDGNSTDETLDSLREYKENFGTYFNFISEQDLGLYDAMNKGWNLCSSDEYICYLGAGDYLLNFPRAVSNESDVYFGKVLLGTEDFRMNVDKFQNKYFGNYIHHQGLLIKRREITSPFDLEFPTYSDYNFNLKLLSTNVRFEYLDGFLTYADPSGISSNLNFIEMIRVIYHNSGVFGFFLFSLSYILKRLYRFLN